MLTEISLNILDIAENSVRADASLIEIYVSASEAKDELVVVIKDNGCGMTPEQLKKAEDPFFTTRTTRKVGFGLSFFKQAALLTGGSFSIESEPSVGTSVKADFGLSHIDRMPLGDITATIHNLVVFRKDIDFYYTYRINDREFVLDTRKLREILGDVPFDTREVSEYIREFLIENKKEIDCGMIL